MADRPLNDPLRESALSRMPESDEQAQNSSRKYLLMQTRQRTLMY